MFYLMTHSTHFIYGYMASGIWLRTIPIVRRETRCRHIGYSFRLTARVLLYAPSHNRIAYHGLCYTSRGALAGTRNRVHPMKDRSDDPSHHERTLLPRSYISLLLIIMHRIYLLNTNDKTCSRTAQIRSKTCLNLPSCNGALLSGTIPLQFFCCSHRVTASHCGLVTPSLL